MRTSDSPYLADWFAITLRWCLLLGITIALVITQFNTFFAILLLFASAIWNIFNSLLAILNRRLIYHRFINVVFDALIVFLMYIFSGGIYGPLAWCGLLVFVTSAIYYEWHGSLLMAFLITLIQSIWSLSASTGGIPTISYIFLFLFNITSAVVFGFISKRLIFYLRQLYFDKVKQRKDEEYRLMRAERERVQAFYQLIEKLSTTLNYQEVLEITLDLSDTIMGHSTQTGTRLVCAMLLFQENDLHVGAARGFSPTDQRLTFPVQQGALAEVVRSGETHLLLDPASDPEIGRITAMHGCKSTLVIPLRRGLDSFGVELFGHPDPQFFDAERADLLNVISHQAVNAIQNAQMYKELEGEKARILETQEEASKKLARDLHDGPAQAIAGIAMRIDVARRLFKQSPEDGDKELAGILELARRTTQEIRHMLFTLRPLVLETEGLAVALKTMAAKMSDTYQQNVSVNTDPAIVERLETNKQTVIFYIAEEAVNNARKHAKASKIIVSLKSSRQYIDLAELWIEDNGVGFNVESVTENYHTRGSLGLVNLRERADLLNGAISIQSAPGQGTTIKVLIPLNQEAADRLLQNL